MNQNKRPNGTGAEVEQHRTRVVCSIYQAITTFIKRAWRIGRRPVNNLPFQVHYRGDICEGATTVNWLTDKTSLINFVWTVMCTYSMCVCVRHTSALGRPKLNIILPPPPSIHTGFTAHSQPGSVVWWSLVRGEEATLLSAQDIARRCILRRFDLVAVIPCSLFWFPDEVINIQEK